MILRLDSAVIRPPVEADADSLTRHANDRRVWMNLRDHFRHPYTRPDALEWIRRQMAAAEPMHFSIDVDGEVVGGIGLARLDDVHRQTADLGYWLGAQYWGRGIATQAVKAMTAYGFEIGLERVQANIFDWNPASARVLEKAGYTLEGRLRRHVTKAGRIGDLLVYARVRGDG